MLMREIAACWTRSPSRPEEPVISQQGIFWVAAPAFALSLLAYYANAQAKEDLAVKAVIDVSHAELTAAPPAANWLSYNGDYTGRRFSSLNQITPANVNQLRAQWVFHARESDSLEVTPVVVNGIM